MASEPQKGRHLLPALILRLALIWVLLPATLWAERWDGFADRIFLNYGSEQGLPSGRASGVAQDADGFIWVVTQQGLLRWDGRVFELLESGLPDVDSDIRVLRADGQGRFWLGTGLGLRCFDPITREFHNLVFDSGGRFAVMDVEFEIVAGELILWLATEQGVFSVAAVSGRTTAHLEGLIEDHPTTRVFAIHKSGDGSIWAGTTLGLFRNPPERSGFQRFDPSPAAPADTRVASIIEDHGGDLWVGTARHGAFVVSGDLHVSAVDIPDFAQEWIFSLAEIRPGVVWLGTYGRGIIEIDRHAARVSRIQHDPLLRNSLPQDEVWTIFPDDHGRVWVGQGRGLSLTDPTQRALLTVFGGGSRSNGLRDAEVKSLLERRDGHILVGLVESGVDILDPATGRVGSIDVDPDRPTIALPGGAVETMVQVDDGDIYVGSNWGLYRYRNGALNRVRFDQRSEQLFAGSLAWHDSFLWVGGTDGLWRVTLGDDPLDSMRIAASVDGSFTDPRISTMATGRDGTLLVGSWNGLNWIDTEGELLRRLPVANSDSSPLANGYITGLLSDAQGRTWLGTSGAGIYLVSEGELTQISRENGLESDVMGALLDDGMGRVWASSSAGIAVIDMETLAVTTLGPAEGAMVAPYFRQPGLRTRAGELLFGGDRGLTVVRPELWQADQGFPPLAIVRIRIGGETVIDRSIGRRASDPLIVPGDSNSLSVEFAALDYLAPSAPRYRFRLRGHEPSWQEGDAEQRTATYTRLPPGEYILDLQSSNRSGQWGREIHEVHFTVLPLWHQTTWARTLFVALGLLALFGIFQLRTTQLRRRQVLLENLVQDRTQELERSAEALREKSRELETASLTDPLTGMRNRRFLDQYMPAEEALSVRRYRDGDGEPLEAADLLLFVVDIDHFKRVNDLHGHAAGDAVLTAMRGRLESVFREGDYLVRWGGEEFLVVARASSRRFGEQLADRIRVAVNSRPFPIGGGKQLAKTCSIGFVAFPFAPRRPDALDWHACVQLADRALYAAKRAARDAWVGVSAGPGLQVDQLMALLVQDPAAAIEDDWVRLASNADARSVATAWAASPHERDQDNGS